MITVLRSSGLRIVIYPHDHEPPHVHVIGDGSAKILLVGADGSPELLRVRGMKFGDTQKALSAVADDQQLLLDLWRQIHG